MNTPAGHVGKPYVALHHDYFSLDRDSSQSQARCGLPGVHDAVHGQRWFLCVLNDQQIKRARVRQSPGHDLGVHQGLYTIREGDRAGLGQHAHFRDLLSCQARLIAP